jgi:starch synthase
MKIAFVSSEIYPFAKTGGLADVSYSLPKAVSHHGIKVISMMPLYKTVDREKHNIVETDLYIDVSLSGKNYRFRVYKLKDDVKYYFFHNEELFDRDFLYGTPEGDYPDNDIRFGAFSYAVIEFFKKTGFYPDVVHTNDWQTALIPVLIKDKYKLPIKTVHTIHNIAYQGVFDKSTIDKLNLGWHLFNMEALEFYGKVNFLKGGIVFSDAVTTVSPTYAREICTPEYGFGLDGVLRAHCHKLYGILNGIDYDVWNPETDPYIYQNYNETSLEKKEKNKQMFLDEYGLAGIEKPLFIFIGRFAKQKGIDIIQEAIPELASMNANFAILGSGDKSYNDFFTGIKNKFPNIFIEVGYDEPLSRKMYASADFLLMPSIYEPCGLNQMIAMRYGTLVVARKTGGLADTVIDIDLPAGYGILFEHPTKTEFIKGINRAKELFRNKKRFYRLREFVMSLDFSWEASASKYIRLYEEVKFGFPKGV